MVIKYLNLINLLILQSKQNVLKSGSYVATCKTKLYEMWTPCKDITIKQKIDNLEKKLDKHIEEIWTVYKPIKKILERLERFKLW